MNNVFVSASSFNNCVGCTLSSSNGIMLTLQASVPEAAAKDDTCMQKDLYWRKPSSKSNSGKPDTGVGNVFLKFPNDQVKICIEYFDSIQVCSSGHPLESRNFLARGRVDKRLTGEAGWKRQLSRMKVCFCPSSSMSQSHILPSCKHGPVPFAVVKLLLDCQRELGTNFFKSLQRWPVVKLSQTKKIESVSKMQLRIHILRISISKWRSKPFCIAFSLGRK